jgi:hypothetical protein
MNADVLDAMPMPPADLRASPPLAHVMLGILALTAILITVGAIVPLGTGLKQLVVLLWFAAPGVVLALSTYRQNAGRWAAACFAGPAWGYALSTVALLAFWTAGVRSFGWLMLAPIAGSIIAWPVGRLVPPLSLPLFTRRDLGPWALVLLSVPAIVGRPYAHLGVDLPEGRAYRAYFTADFVWQMAVVSEVSKGEVPPRNPYYLSDDLHYYWLTHLLPAAEHRAAGRALRIEQLLIVDALWLGLAFVGFFYFFVRHFVDRPWAAAMACVGVLFCSSFEGIQQIWLLWQRGQSLEPLRMLNIDAMTRWMFQGMPIDGLHRLLLYQPQHQLAYLLGFSALLLLIQSRDSSKASLLFLVGFFLAVAMLMSPFAAGMLAIAVAIYESWRLVQARQWRAFVTCALAAAVPMVAALAVTRLMRSVDGGSPLVTFGVNRIAARQWPWAIFLSFGPVLLVAITGLAAVILRRELGRFIALGIVLTVCTIFYFWVDVPDHQGVYVGWHVGKIAFVALAPWCAFALQDLWSRRGWPRRLMGIAALSIALAALPTVLIDLYNTQDIGNRDEGPGFRWTVVLTPDEVKALDWIKQWTPPTARVQVEPYVRGRDTWAYIPAFAERRMSAGLPISMIPLAKYESASQRIRRLYRSTSAPQAYDLSVALCVDYLVIGPPERAAYPELQRLLDGSPHLFAPAFRNDAMAVYAVSYSGSGSRCAP